ncbi:TetR/AcrR family transcriptional regulator [Nocardia sp. NPDC088792]|uniref:TetR/AcrR family transcriptional regulator n=1 Tax=Nocardia sp. NPDC088792 TaxID=3364332 RepID=UPI003825F98F
MARWEPDTERRLQQAAMELFAERGYAAVTIAEIAERAGLTKRTFFNYFTDKREVLFAGAQAFEAGVVGHLTDSDANLAPIEVAIAALTRAGQELAGYSEFAAARQQLIASSSELQERDLNKMTALAAAIAESLGRRGVPARIATLAAQAAVAVFTAAYAAWVEDATADLHVLMQQSLADLRRAVGAPS